MKKQMFEIFGKMEEVHIAAIMHFHPLVLQYLKDNFPKSPVEVVALASALVELADGVMSSAMITAEQRAQLFELQAKASANNTTLYGEQV